MDSPVQIFDPPVKLLRVASPPLSFSCKLP
jgi:hypothetical protein